MLILNPTGGTIRNDKHGSGYYHAPRTHGIHKGIDLTIPEGPGQALLAPITGRFDRVCYPYEDDLRWKGGVFSNEDISIRIFYFEPDQNLYREEISMGQVVGVTQDLSIKYPGMIPHIHMQVGEHGEINPLLLM